MYICKLIYPFNNTYFYQYVSRAWERFFKIRFIYYDHSYYKDFQNKISVKIEYFNNNKKTLKKPSESNLEEEKI